MSPDAASRVGSAAPRAAAYPTVWRIIGGVLVGVSRASLPMLAVGVITADGIVPLAVLVRVLLIWAVLPALSAWLIERAFLVNVEVHSTELVLGSRGLRMEIPCTAIRDIIPWRLPLPGPGFALRMQSGRRFSAGLQLADPTTLLSALAEKGGVPAAHVAMHHPILVYTHAKRSRGRWRWYHMLSKFVLFALAPTALWFNAHQHIAYGGLLGQYYLEGLVPYLQTFFVSWGVSAVYLLLYASLWRSLGEGTALLAAWLVPRHAATARRVVEVTCAIVYYVGVPVIVLLPFLA